MEDKMVFLNDYDRFIQLLRGIELACGHLMKIDLFDESHSDFSDEVYLRFKSTDAAARFYLFLHHSLDLSCSLYLNSDVVRVLFVK